MTAQPSQGRRALLYGAVAAAATAGGLGWAWWRDKLSAELSETAGGVWDLRFPQPGGGELVMQALRGRPLVLNFWATWCPPCVKEMPDLDRFQRQFAAQGWQVVGLAIDAPTAVREFLARTPVGYPIGLAGLDGTGLSRRLGNEGGALPFTVVFNAAGRVVQRKLGESSLEEMQAWVKLA
jgi:thiol-disulfide isomerase/thioredoxin